MQRLKIFSLIFSIIILTQLLPCCAKKEAGKEVIYLDVGDVVPEGLGEIKPVERESGSDSRLGIQTVSPTVFFVRENGLLFQLANVTIRNKADNTGGMIEIETKSEVVKVDLGVIPSSSKTYCLKVPDMEEESPLTMRLYSQEALQEMASFAWQPQRHWKIYAVQVAHFDYGYTDTHEGVGNRRNEILDNVLGYIQQTDDWPEDSRFHWMIESSWALLNYLRNHPEKEEILRQYLQQGRIELGATYMNQITPINSYEELIRITYPSKRLRDLFDIETRTAILNDCPGYTWSLTQILSGAGVRYFAAGPNFFYRGGNILNKTTLPQLYYWAGPDGSRVLFWRSKQAYTEWNYMEAGGPLDVSEVTYDRTFKALPSYLEGYQTQGYIYDALHILHSKTDNGLPSLDLTILSKEWNERWAYPRIICTTSSPFFEYMEEKYGNDIPTIAGDCPDWWADGVITSAYEAGLARDLHRLISSAEKFSAVASMVSDHFPYPREDLSLAYDEMIKFDEHTWGYMLPSADTHNIIWDTRKGWLYDAKARSETVIEGALEEVSSHINTEYYAFIVYNPLSWDRSDIVRIQLPEAFAVDNLGTAHFIIKDPDDQEEIPYQTINNTNDGSSETMDIIFIARDVPSLGYKTYFIMPSQAVPDYKTSISMTDDNIIENNYFRLSIGAESGGITSIWDKGLERELVDPGARFAFNQYVYRTQDYAGTIDNMSGSIITSIRPGVLGPVMGSIVVDAHDPENPGARLEQSIVLYDKIKRIDLSNRLINYHNEQGRSRYFAFPLSIPDFRIKLDIPDAVMTPYYQQLPGCAKYYAVGNWVDIYSLTEDFGVVWSTVEAPIVEFGEITKKSSHLSSLGLLYPQYAYNPGIYPYDPPYSRIYSEIMNNFQDTNFWYQQSGTATWNYSLASHRGGWDREGVVNSGLGANNPLIAGIVPPNPEGILPLKRGFLYLDKGNVKIISVKLAEDGDGYIIRLYENSGEDTVVKLFCTGFKDISAFQTNLVEEYIQDLPVQENYITINMRAFGLSTISIGHR